MNRSLVIIEWILECCLLEDLGVRHDSYKIDQAGASLRTHIPSSFAHSRRNAVRHVNIIHNARSITNYLGTRQLYRIVEYDFVTTITTKWKLAAIPFLCCFHFDPLYILHVVELCCIFIWIEFPEMVTHKVYVYAL